ncbi:MAG: hypothetical protein JNM71_13145 [Flavobacterium lindanitolerans]|uniref:hypothetical protein n=1 Tax=Flavobacterium lindanitolerans TaxID=428988 RepID=UPI001A4AEE4D|nr:hypothetical protein [Flavobacterium lindanitolerans]MBL7868954.1 hypothetical protein [Flavobacterium lindanitolerans]
MLLKYKIFLFLLITIRALGQDNIISKYEKADLNYKGRIYSERLEIDNNKSLLLKIEENSFLVFNEKNDVYSYYVTPSNTILKNKMNRNESIKCLQYLDSLKSINPSNLNVTETKADKPDSLESISVEDGITYSLEFFKNNITIQYHTYSPEVYIEHKFPFYKERQKLLNAFNYYKSIFKYSRKDNLGLKRTDSLYIIFDFKMTDGIGKSWVKKPNNDEVFSVWNTEKDSIVLIKENAIQAQNPYVSKRFLKKQKNNKY